MTALNALIDNARWILLGAAVVIVLYLLLRPRRRAAKSPPRRDYDEAAQLRSQLLELERRYNAQLEFFINFPEVVRSLTAALSVDQVLSACSRGAQAMLQTRDIGLFVARDGGALLLVDGAGYPLDYRGKLRLERDKLGLDALLERRGVVKLADFAALRAHLQRLELAWEHAAPVYHGDTLLGLILVGRAAGEARMTDRLLAMLADLTAVGIHAAGKVAMIRDEAERDALTGLPNRRTLETWLARALQRCRAYNSPVSLAMIDVDHFKTYNDTNGHQAGDEALVRVGALLSAATRRTDLVARYGGEEFTVVLAGAGAAQATGHAERIRAAIEAHDFAGGATQPLGRVTISVGVATFPRHARDAASLFERADKALYRAKQNGRNRVENDDGAAGAP